MFTLVIVIIGSFFIIYVVFLFDEAKEQLKYGQNFKTAKYNITSAQRKKLLSLLHNADVNLQKKIKRKLDFWGMNRGQYEYYLNLLEKKKEIKSYTNKTKNSNFQNNKKSSRVVVKVENKKKPATYKQKNFLKELINRNEYEVIERILISNKLLDNLNIELASNIISHILNVENLKDKKFNSVNKFFEDFPQVTEIFLKLTNFQCLGITEKLKRCSRNIKNFPNYFCEIHSKDSRKYDFGESLAREYFYRDDCKKFISSLFEFLTLESKENNFKLEILMKSMIKEHVGENKYRALIDSIGHKSFKDLFFNYNFFSAFTSLVLERNEDLYEDLYMGLNCFNCSLGSFIDNSLCSEHSNFSDFHLMYEFDFFPKKNIGNLTEIYYTINNLVKLDNYFHSLIEIYYLAVKDYNSDY